MIAPEINHPCPACGFLMHDDEAYGSYFICSLCCWEDDPVQLANPLTVGGANGDGSLLDYQHRALAQWPIETQEIEHQGARYRRDPRWRPLSEKEIEHYALHTDNGKTYAFASIGSIDECYWMNSPVQR